MTQQGYQDVQDKQSMQYQHCIQVKMEESSALLKLPKSECPDIWTRPPRHKWPKAWSNMEDPVAPLERILYGLPLAGLLWKGQFERSSTGLGWDKVPNWECLFVHRQQSQFLSVCVDDMNLVGRKQNLNLTWENLMRLVDLATLFNIMNISKFSSGRLSSTSSAQTMS